MKSFKVLLICLLLCSPTLLMGQKNFGLSIGFDNTKFSGAKPDGITYDFKSGFSIVGFVDFQIADKIQLSLRPGYARGGGNIVVKDTVGLDDENPFIFPIEDSYLNLAALLKIYNREKIYVAVGPELGYLFTSEAQVNNQPVDLSEQLNEFALGLNIGFGLNFQMFKQSWAAEWQLNQMLTTLTEKVDINNGVAPKIRTTRTRLALIYKFKKK